jgi:hypothetical protein
MRARVIRTYILPDQVDDAIWICNTSVVPILKTQPGFNSLSFLVNPESGAVVFITYWETEAELQADEAFFEQLLARFNHITRPDVRAHGQVYDVSIQL